MKTVAIIQARMTSSRLPGKVLADVAGKPVLEHVVTRAMRARTLDLVAVATTTNATDDPVVALCSALGVPVERGSEHPLAGAVVGAAAERGLALGRLAGFRSIPGKGVLGEVDARQVALGNPLVSVQH